MDATIVIVNRQLAEPEHLLDAVRCSLSQVAVKSTIFVSERKANGWIEYAVCVEYESGREMTIGVIQRRPGMETEWCS